MKVLRSIGLLVVLLMTTSLSLFSQAIPSETQFSILRSSTDSIQLRFELPQWKLESTVQNGETRHKISVKDAHYIFIDEEETLPVFTTTIAIPYSGGASLSPLGTANPNRSRVTLDFDDLLSRERTAGRYSDALYPASSSVISEPKVIRDFRVVSINIYPFQYDQSSKQLIVNESMDIQISFDRNPSINEIEPPTQISRSFESIYRGLILNYYEMITRNTVYQNPVMLVIWGFNSDTIYQGKVNEYINWKKQKGYKVYSASTSTTGTTNTAIKTYIQNAYNTWTDKPEHIVLIGDITGSMIVPTFETYKDYHYTWLAGGDGLGDVFIGRISVENSSQLVSYVAKMYMMERDINPANVSWMNSMLLVGDTASSGISTIYTNEYIYDVSSHVNSDYTYTKLYGANPSPANMNTAINQGVSFFNYRGYIGMSGWGGQNHDALLLNNNKPFHAVIITCSTGDINNTATTETIVRLGTEAQVRGAFTAIGMATSLTSTPMNNCLDVGIFHAIYPLGMRNMGAAMLYGKLYLNAIYGVSKPTQATNFAAYCNLVGDPTAAVYVGIPNSFIASTPSTIPAGTNLVELTVRNSSNQIVSGASVTITNAAGTLQALGSSNVQGYVVLDLPPSLTGSLVVTISKDDFKPLVNTISISTTGGIVFEEVWADDGNSGNSTGNGDGIVNGGENIELWVTLRNSSTAALSVSGTVSCTDPYITIPDNRISFGNISAGGTAMNTEALFFLVAANCPDNRRVVFNLSGTTPSGPWTVGIPIIIRNGKLNIQSYSIVGAPGNVINPGNQYPMTFTLNNTGLADLAGVSGILRSYDGLFTIPDSLGYFGNIASGASANNALNTFQVFASGQSVVGMTVPLELYLYNSQGYSESKSLTLTIGQTTVNHPLGQDAYGYFIFDMGDAGYPQRPTYNWIGIAPAEGGTGTALTLTDPGAVSDEGDQVGAVSITTVNLPFPFKFYGRSYTQASISANGFIAFGSTTDSDWRNWRLPGAGGPNPMIAAFWDDLQLNAGSYVYTFYNASQRYYVVEWYNVISGFDRVTPLTFQAILYDPVYYPTQTGDGQIKLQYKVFNNIDTGSGDTNPHGNYATIGIKDHNGTVGLEYTFNNQYPAAAAPLSNLSALFVTTRPILLNNPYLAIGQINILDANGNGNLDSGENANLSIRLTNLGTQPATNVSAILSTTSPFVTVTTANANYGTIAASANGDPLSNFAITVANNCPNGHLASFALAITSSQGTWNNDFTLPLHAPALAFGTMIISDPAPGNNNGRLDPGETVTISMPLNNTGGTASQSGSATLTSPTIGISISGSPASFGSIATGGSVYLNYTISASAGMSVGTLATFNFNATAAAYTATKTENISIGLIMEDFESGTFTAFPWTFSGNLPWTITGTGAYAGTYAAKSGTITHSQTSSMQTTRVLAASGTLTFWYKVTSEGNYDYLRFYVDEVLQNSPGWAGTIGWTQASYTLAAGTRALRWEYMKDGSVSTGDDCAWIDNIVFPASTSSGVFNPPQDLSASPSHQSVKLDWQAPAAGTPTGYKIFKNGTLLTSVTALTYTDLAVTNGTSYAYYLKAVYSGGDSDVTATVNATPNAVAPSNLAATTGSGIVNLTWTSASGRGELELSGNSNRAISGYRVYRNGVALTTVTATSYQDTGLTNGVSYSYYVTTVYTNPAGESAPSNTVNATPTQVSFTTLGAGTSVTATNVIGLINLGYKSVHGQAVYTATELSAAGVVGPIDITQVGFYAVSPPNLPLPNFIIRMKHTTATNVASWQTAAGMTTVYTNPSFIPTTGAYQMLSLATPFRWNGTDNIVIDTAFGLAAEWSNSGTWQFTSIEVNSYRRAFSDTADQTNVFSGGSNANVRPNVRLALQPIPVGPMIATSPASLAYGAVAVGSSAVQQFSIQNTGDQDLSGSVTTPGGYTVSATARENSSLSTNTGSQGATRNTISFSIPAGQSRAYNLSFAPTAVAAYNGNVVISSNAVNLPTVNIGLTGNGFVPPTISVSHTEISLNLRPGQSGSTTFEISNSGSQALNYSIGMTPSNPLWLGVSPLSGSIAAGQLSVITASFSAQGLVSGIYEAVLSIASNDPVNPSRVVNVRLSVVNSSPIITLPARFEFAMNSSLVVDFNPYVSDPDGDPLVLSYSGNSNVNIVVNGRVVTFSAAQNWIGTETITFGVNDGFVSTFANVPVSVLLNNLAAPVLSVTNNAQGIVLQWNAILHATQYHIYRSPEPNGIFSYIGSTSNLSYIDTFPTARAFYYVKAVNTAPAR